VDVVRSACYLGVFFFPNFVSCSLQLLWQEIFASGNFVAYALPHFLAISSISPAGNARSLVLNA